MNDIGTISDKKIADSYTNKGKTHRKTIITMGRASLLMRRVSPEYRKRENEIYDRIRQASNEFDRLSKAGMNAAEAFLQLEAALEEFGIFRRES